MSERWRATHHAHAQYMSIVEWREWVADRRVTESMSDAELYELTMSR